MTVATEANDGFLRFLKSAEINSVKVEVYFHFNLSFTRDLPFSSAGKLLRILGSMFGFSIS